MDSTAENTNAAILTSYRFRFLDHRNHSLDQADMKYATDAFACEAARIIFQSDPIEVWQAQRFVCRVYDGGLHLAAKE
jgi:hypothetical protein